MKKLNSYLIYKAFGIFVIWYLIASYNNVYACDDYWHGTNVHNFGFWHAQSYYWNNWEGSYIHTFFATIPHVFTSNKTPFMFNVLSLINTPLKI